MHQNDYGKYGILREEHYYLKQRSYATAFSLNHCFYIIFCRQYVREFEAYVTEVKGLPGVLGQGRGEVAIFACEIFLFAIA